MNNDAGLHSAGQKRDFPIVGPGQTPVPNIPAPGQIQYDATGIAVKFERCGSSASLKLQDAIISNPSAKWKPLSPDQSDGSASTCERSSVSPLAPESPANITVPGPSAGDRGQQQQHAALPKGQQRAGRSGGSGSAQPGKGRTAARFHHHPQVWESHKAQIEEIYMNENKSLRQLMDIMKDTKDFKATLVN